MFSFWYWWVAVVRGLLAIALGLFALVSPIAAIAALVVGVRRRRAV